MGWYNDEVDKVYELKYPYDTLALCVISAPDMFDKGFKSFVKSCEFTGSLDPLDEFISSKIKKLHTVISDKQIDIMFDYEVLPNRRPKVLVQTAGHVSGAAFYYRKESVKNQPSSWGENAKIYGVSIHENYGGWFAFRGVVIVKDVLAPDLKKTPPVDVLSEDEKKIEVLEKYNYHWKDWSYRDVAPVSMKYSDEQKLYFETPPSERRKLLEKFF